MPFLALGLPFDQGVNFGDSGYLVDVLDVDGALEKGVHVEFAARRTFAQEFEDAFEPAHKGGEEAIVVDVDFVDEFVEVVLMAGAEVDEGLDRLVWVCGDVLALHLVKDAKHIVDEGGEVGDAVVDIGGFVDADEWFVEYCEEVAEKLECHGLKRNELVYVQL